ncbi:MAG TPA: thioredoxin domain-containing protein [Lachnospiraceae bacterium]|nr:thioredoxin domain-containing protein [Lachnospiraceae bacterium]
MQKVTFFYLPGCPYCRQANLALDELVKENPEYGKVEFERIDESRNAEKAAAYDYYNVPAMFIGNEKIYEAHPGESAKEARANVENVLKKALS